MGMDTIVDRYFPEHERVVRLSRLAMLIECEGTIGIGMTPPTKTRNRPALCAAVSVANTAKEIISEAGETLSSEGIGFTSMPRRYQSGFGTKLRYDVSLHGFNRVSALLTAILPYLRSKKRQAILVLEFIESRRASDLKAAYSDREWRLVTEVRLLNHCQPNSKALAKAKAYLASPTDPNKPRTAEYFRKYVEMCTELQEPCNRLKERKSICGLAHQIN